MVKKSKFDWRKFAKMKDVKSVELNIPEIDPLIALRVFTYAWYQAKNNKGLETHTQVSRIEIFRCTSVDFLLTVHNEKSPFILLANKNNLMLFKYDEVRNNQFNGFSINLNVQYVIGMTHFSMAF